METGPLLVDSVNVTEEGKLLKNKVQGVHHDFVKSALSCKTHEMAWFQGVQVMPFHKSKRSLDCEKYSLVSMKGTKESSHANVK